VTKGKPIARDQVLPLLAETDSRFPTLIEEFEAEWEGEELPLYLLSPGIAELIADDIKTGAARSNPAPFRLIERLIVDGDDYVSELAVIGFLEDIQNHLLRSNTGLILAHDYLLSESKECWLALEHFWSKIP
jgi:hypothetical protein